jgi:8-oxo-dGTP pyrophosphatase MutT (NUDIX family)
MNFDPQKFFIGIVDLFSILLPGAAVVFLAWQWEPARELIEVDIGTGPQAWLVFFFASYLVGHFLFLVGAQLDDLIYDPLAKATDIGSIQRLGNGGALASRLRRGVARGLLGKTDDSALIHALRIKALALGPDAGAVNTFQWSKARLSRHHPPGLAAVERFEADSKFFRSLMVALLLVTPVLAIQRLWLQAAICLVLLGLALWRYANQRRKGTHQAYWFVIALDEVHGTAGKARQRGPGELTHAGGVVYREGESGVEYLLITAEKDRAEWVLPKGHIEPGEPPRETAVREVREETGHWARIKAPVGDVSLGTGAAAPRTRFYLMELVEQDTATDTQRLVRDCRAQLWLPRDQAIDKAKFDESKQAIRDADAARLNPAPR